MYRSKSSFVLFAYISLIFIVIVRRMIGTIIRKVRIERSAFPWYWFIIGLFNNAFVLYIKQFLNRLTN